jgi:excinuclease ABC subunit C
VSLPLQEALPAPRTLEALKRRVQANAARQPGVYEFLGVSGEVIYVGKAKSLRQRLLSYFSAPPESKGAHLVRAATGIRWRYVPSEFAALLEELRLIQRLRPRYNVTGNRTWASIVFVRLTGAPAPRFAVSDRPKDPAAYYYGPFRGRGHTVEALRILSDLLGLRDCAERTRMQFGDQPSLFDSPPAPLCIRHELGTCLGPCAARVGVDRYARAAEAARDFLEGRAAHPLDLVLERMAGAAEAREYERATHWRGKFDELTRFFASVARLRAAVEGLSFVYTSKDESGGADDRVYLVRRGTVRAVAGLPRTPIEREAFAALVRRHTEEPEATPAARSGTEMQQLLLVMSWFRQNPEAYDATSTYGQWTA